MARGTAEDLLRDLGSPEAQERVRAVLTVMDAALFHLELEPMLHELLLRLREVARADTASILLCTPAGDRLRVRASVGLEEGLAAPVMIPFGQGIAGTVARRKQPLIVDDVSRMQVVDPALRQLRSMMLAPLLVHGEVIGVVHVGSRSGRTFSEDDLHLLTLVAGRAAMAVDRARLLEEARRDLDERRAAERALERSEIHHRALFDGAAIGIAIVDLEGRVSLANPALARMLGYAPEELRGRASDDVTHPDDREADRALFRRLLETGENVYSLEKRYVRKDGSLAWGRLTVSLVRSAAGVPEYAIGMVEDVSDRRRADAALRESEERARLLFERSPLPMWVFDLESLRILDANEAAVRHYGWSREELTRMTLRDVRPPDELPRLRRAFEDPARGVVKRGAFRHRRKDGEVIEVEVTTSEVTYGGRPARIALIVDVTERNQAERLARRQMEVLAEAGRVLSASLSVEETFEGLARFAAETVADYSIVYLLDEAGERLRRAVVAHADPRREATAARLLDQAPPSLSLEPGAGRVVITGEPVLTPDLRPEDLERAAAGPEHLEILRALGPRSTILVPLRARGRTVGALAAVTVEGGKPRFRPEDVSLLEELARRAALAADNARLFEEAQAASVAKSQFLATMSHELRTPLNAVVGYTDLLESGIAGPVTGKQSAYLQRIGVSTRLLVQLIDDILSFSRVEAGREEVHESPVVLADLVAEAISLVEPLADGKGIAVALRAGPPLEVRTDPGKVRQIVLNLLSNAVKFTDEGRVDVTVEERGGGARIRVRDTGPGIPPESLSRIWEPFTQLDQSSTRRQGGTGLGLTVSLSLARLLGGDLSVESTPGRGSTFCLDLPRGGTAGGA